MQQGIDAANIDKGAIACQAANNAVDGLAFLDLPIAGFLDGPLFLFGYSAVVDHYIFFSHI